MSQDRGPGFIADADLRHSIVVGVRQREPGIDFLTAHEGGTIGLSDPAVLAIHSREGRLLVSSDCNTMVGHFYASVAAGKHCPGLIIVPQDLSDGDAIDDLVMLWAASDPGEFNNQVIWLPI
jgi:hypothetical protein